MRTTHIQQREMKLFLHQFHLHNNEIEIRTRTLMWYFCDTVSWPVSRMYRYPLTYKALDLWVEAWKFATRIHGLWLKW